MVTILLQQILDLLKGFFGDFVEWCNTMGDHMAAIHTNTDSLPDIETNTDSIAADTTSIKNAVQNLVTWIVSIYHRVNGIETNTGIIKNNSGSIATSAGAAAAFAEDCATNTLNIDNRLVTIGSDTTQIRADTTSLAANVAEIKDTLGLYLYNTIVTEDAEGNVALCDTDLKDYLTEAKVTIPADAGGISGINVNQVKKNLFAGYGNKTYINPNTDYYMSSSEISGGKRIRLSFFDETDTQITPVRTAGTSGFYVAGNGNLVLSGDATYLHNVFGVTNADVKYFIVIDDSITSYNYPNYPDIQVEEGTAKTDYEGYSNTTTAISFTSITDGAEIDLLTGLIKINTSPVTYDSITPIAIRTYKGVNNFYSDIGTTSVTYRETLKHYLKKQEA